MTIDRLDRSPGRIRPLRVQAVGRPWLIGPGHLFCADLRAGAWMRFNVAFCNDERVFAFLEGQRRGA